MRSEPTGGCKVNRPARGWAEIIQAACLVQRRVRMAARDGYRALQDRMRVIRGTCGGNLELLSHRSAQSNARDTALRALVIHTDARVQPRASNRKLHDRALSAVRQQPSPSACAFMAVMHEVSSKLVGYSHHAAPANAAASVRWSTMPAPLVYLSECETVIVCWTTARWHIDWWMVDCIASRKQGTEAY